MTGEPQGQFDIAGLTALISTRQKENQFLSAPREINPITGTMINPQLQYAFSNRLGIAGIPRSQSFQPYLYPRSGLEVAETI